MKNGAPKQVSCKSLLKKWMMIRTPLPASENAVLFAFPVTAAIADFLFLCAAFTPVCSGRAFFIGLLGGNVTENHDSMERYFAVPEKEKQGWNETAFWLHQDFFLYKR